MKDRSVFLLGSLALLTATIYIIFISLIAINPQAPSLETKEFVKTFFPEGWAFFTRNPKEEILDVYTIDVNNNIVKVLLPNGDYYLGASRQSRIITFQLGNLLKNSKGLNWKQGTGNFKDSLSVITFKKIPSNKAFSLFSKGIYILVITKRLPWLWATKPLNTKQVFEIVGINIV